MATKADCQATPAGFGKVIASNMTMDVYNSLGKVVDTKVSNYLMSSVNAGDVKTACQGLTEGKDVTGIEVETVMGSLSAALFPEFEHGVETAMGSLSAVLSPEFERSLFIFCNSFFFWFPLYSMPRVDYPTPKNSQKVHAHDVIAHSNGHQSPSPHDWNRFE